MLIDLIQGFRDMNLNLELSPDDQRALEKKARDEGVDLATYALRVLQREAKRPSLADALAPIRARFKATGTTDEQFLEEYEAEKHAKRRETSR